MPCGKYLIENSHKMTFGKLIVMLTSGNDDLDLLGVDVILKCYMSSSYSIVHMLFS